MLYTAKKIATPPQMNFNWEAWKDAETAELTCIRQESSDHHPKTQLRLFHDADHIYGLYRVEDRYVKAVHQGYQEQVCNDSCVEFFFRPNVGPGYFNLEMNAGGSYLFYYIRNWQRTPNGFVDYEPVDVKYGQMVTVKTSLPSIIDPEIVEPTTWYAQFEIPIAALAHYCGETPQLNGQEWRCNFYKCGEEVSHPHWITWSPVSYLNFHLPECFGTLKLE